MNRHLTALILTGLFVIAPLSGCFGEDEQKSIDPAGSLQIDFVNPEDAVLRAGEFHDFTLVGEGNSIATQPDVLIFINGTYVKSHMVVVEDNTVYGQLLTIRIIDFIRPEMKFSGIEDLKTQIAVDAKRAKELLSDTRS